MKKIIAVLLLLVMCFTLYACEEKPTNTNAENTNTNVEESISTKKLNRDIDQLETDMGKLRRECWELRVAYQKKLENKKGK